MPKRKTRPFTCRRRIGCNVDPLERRVLFSLWSVGDPARVTPLAPTIQSSGDVAVDAAGGYIVTWTQPPSEDPGNSTTEVFMRRYNAAGTALGAAVQVNTFTPNNQYSPRVASASDGRFVITWFSSGGDGSISGISARLYDASGIPQGDEFIVNTYTTGPQEDPTIAMNGSGDFVIAWESGESLDPSGPDGSGQGIFAQRFSSTGARLGSEFRVNNSTNGDQSDPSVGITQDGRFVICWSQTSGIMGRRYSSGGLPQGTDMTVASGAGLQDSSADMDAAGNFVVAWESGDIRALRFNASGTATGESFRLNSYTTNSQVEPSIDVADDGSFAATWSSLGQDGNSWGSFIAMFGANDKPKMTDVQINTHTTGQQVARSVAVNNDGAVVVAWDDFDAQPLQGVYTRRFHAPTAASGSAVGDRVWRDSNGNGIQDAGENGLAGVRAELFDSLGQLHGLTTSDSTGAYVFYLPPLQSGYLRFTLPTGFKFSAADQGDDDGLDSDIDASSGLSPVFVASLGGSSDSSLDVGIFEESSVSGTAFLDRNQNGTRESLEELAIGVPVFADYDSDGALDNNEPLTFSGAGGTFKIPNVAVGDYLLGVGEPGLWIGPGTPLALHVVADASVSGLSLPVRTTAKDTASFAMPQQFSVNTYTSSTQVAPSIASADDGGYVIAWQSSDQDGSGSGIYAQRFSANGSKAGSEFQINQFTGGNQADPSVAMSSTGKFTIAWEGVGPEDSAGIYLRLFGSDGSPLTDQFLVNQPTNSSQIDPAVAVDPSGNITVVWAGAGSGDGEGIFARRFDSTGNAIGSEFRVNTVISGSQTQPAVAVAGDGTSLIAWKTEGTLSARRFDSTGEAIGNQTDLALDALAYPASIGGDADGNFVIAWTNFFGGQVFARRFSSAHGAFSDRFTVNTYTALRGQESPTVAMSSEGDFAISWHNRSQEGNSDGVYAQRYNAAGIPQGVEFHVNTYTTLSQENPTAAMDSDGNLIIAWQGSSAEDSAGISARRFAIAETAAVASGQFAWQSSPQHIDVAFDNPDPSLIAAMTPVNLVLQNITTGVPIASSDINLQWGMANQVAQFSFPNLPNALLPNGRYVATVYPGNAPAWYTYSFEFLFLNGDANHDARVDARDLVPLADNWLMTSGFDYRRGDFNLDGIVDAKDLTILAGNWQASLPALAPPLSTPAPTSAGRPGVRTPTRNVIDTSALLDSTAQRIPTRPPIRPN